MRRIIMWTYRGIHYTPVTLLLIISQVHSEIPDTAALKINDHFTLFGNASESFKINAKYLSAIVYVERTLNYNWTDDVLDLLIAKMGRSSSLGFCQVKMKTAYWIEVQLNDSTSNYYPGNKFQNILPVSNSPEEIIAKLTSDSLNILYAAAYIRIIQTRWEKAGFSVDDRPDIIGTLYSTGLFYPNGHERVPRKDPKSNEFGKKVAESLEIFRNILDCN